MKSGDIASSLNRVAFVGARPDLLSSIPSLILSKLFESRGKAQSGSNFPSEIFYFSNYSYEGNLGDLNFRDDSQFLHIHSMPSVLKEKPFDLIVYVLQNTSESYLYNWIRESYPGVVLLLDASLFNVELSSLFHATDPIGIDKKIASTYPKTQISIGKQHVLGHSIDIYSGVFNFLGNLENDLSIVVLENRISDLLSEHFTNIHCLPLATYLFKDSGTKEFIEKEFTRSLFILNSPFSLSAKELRILAGYESYRELIYPAYFILESNLDTPESISKIEEVEIDLEFVKNLDNIILTDVNVHQGIPAIAYLALLEGVKLSMPEFTRQELSCLSDINFHSRLSSYKEILESLDATEVKQKREISDEFAERLFNILGELSTAQKVKLENKSNERKLSLNSRLKSLSDCYKSLEGEFKTYNGELNFNEPLKEMFNYEIN